MNVKMIEHLGRQTFAYIMLTGSILAQPACATVAPVAVGGVTVGAALELLMDRLQTAIAQAREAGRSVVADAGSQVALAIDQTKVAYAESLDKTEAAAGRVVAGSINDLRSAVSAIERQTAKDAEIALQRAQIVANSLPLSKHDPQVAMYTPHMIVRDGEDIRVSINGNFVDSARKGYEPELRGPRLEEGAAGAPPLELTTTALTFTVPSDQFSAPETSKITLASLHLNIPFRHGRLIKRRRVGTFRLLIGTLPPTPGKILFQPYVESWGEEQKVFSTAKISQHSSNDDHKDVLHCVTVDDGWTVIPGTEGFHVEWHQGNENDQWSKVHQKTAGREACYRVTTIHHRFGTSGKVDFRISVTARRTVSTSHWDPEIPVDLAWGRSKSFDVPSTKWKVFFEPFSGEKQEITSPNEGKYLTISTTNAGKTVEIHVPDAEEIMK